MSRHQHAQSAAPSVPPLNTEEIKFWLKIMEEHAVFIRAGLPCDQTDLIGEAKTFQQEFKNLRVRAEKSQSEKKFCELVSQICCSLKEYIRYKRLLLCLSLTGKLCGSLYPLFLDHLIREAEYFMALLPKTRGKTIEMVKALETDFWLRIMADHTHLLRQLVDPSEKGIISVVNGYTEEFDALSAQARVFTSMLHCQTAQFPVFDRFLKDSNVAATRLRDFKKAMHDMICCNKLLSIIPALMADHVRREADHFLLVLAMMEKDVVKNCKYNEASAAKYSPVEFGPVETEREFGELIEYAHNSPSADGAPESGRVPVHKPKFGGKMPVSEKKGSAAQLKKSLNPVEEYKPPSWGKNSGIADREDPEAYEKFEKRDPNEDDSDGNLPENPFVLNDETVDKIQDELPLPPPEPNSIASPLESHFAQNNPETSEATPKHLSHLAPSHHLKSQKHKTGVKWPRQLGK